MSPDPPLLARLERADWPWLAGLVVGVAALTFAVTRRMMVMGLDSDFGHHIQLTEAMARSGRILAPHFLYHFSTIAVHAGLSVWDVSFAAAGTLVTVGYTALLTVLVYLLLRPVCQAPGSVTRGPACAAGLAVVVLLVAPITLPTWPRHNLYYGYFGINVYHNPAISVLKPLALLLSVVTVRMCLPATPRRLASVAAAGGLTVLATLAKPNYVLCLLPVVALIGIYRTGKRQNFDWPLAAAVAVPAVLVLAWQYQFTYGEAEPILFAPLSAMKWFTSPRSILPKLLLSILFPLGVYALYWRRARADLYLNLSWLVFGVGLSFAFLLAEGGERRGHGNFLWGAQVGLFVLFIAATRFWVRHAWIVDRSTWPARWGRWGGGALLVLHLASGLLWYYSQLTLGMGGWW